MPQVGLAHLLNDYKSTLHSLQGFDFEYARQAREAEELLRVCV
jgi:hypothetical protein